MLGFEEFVSLQEKLKIKPISKERLDSYSDGYAFFEPSMVKMLEDLKTSRYAFEDYALYAEYPSGEYNIYDLPKNENDMKIIWNDVSKRLKQGDCHKDAKGTYYLCIKLFVLDRKSSRFDSFSRGIWVYYSKGRFECEYVNNDLSK